jgi:hypothetical protein
VTETVVGTLAKRVSALEEHSLILERRSGIVGGTVRTLCDRRQFSRANCGNFLRAGRAF